MKPDPRFLTQPKHFWAYVRTISEQIGYTERKTKRILVPTAYQVRTALRQLSLDTTELFSEDGSSTQLGREVMDYLAYRAEVLHKHVEPQLMDADRARMAYEAVTERYQPTIPTPMNKQSKEKKRPAYLTGIVNAILEGILTRSGFEHNPTALTTVTREHRPLRTLARRVDGAYPSIKNPHAVWEIKEYYYTTTFGSRIADGVYESLLDGMELEELREAEGIHVRHYLMVDAHYTWWSMGKSYLCRIVDMLNMGYLDEALFGYEVVQELPRVASEWLLESPLDPQQLPPLLP